MLVDRLTSIASFTCLLLPTALAARRRWRWRGGRKAAGTSRRNNELTRDVWRTPNMRRLLLRLLLTNWPTILRDFIVNSCRRASKRLRWHENGYILHEAFGIFH